MDNTAGNNANGISGSKPPVNNVRFIFSTQRSIIVGIVTFFILALLTGGFLILRYKNSKEKQKEEALVLANYIRARLQESLANSLSATKTLSLFIQKDGSVKHFDSIAPLILETSKEVDHIQLAPGGIISYVYPLKGNEQFVGYNILEDTINQTEEIQSIHNKTLLFDGPRQLKFGGIGMIARLPVYRNDSFWGFTSVIIKMPAFLNAAGLDSSAKNGYYLQLSKTDKKTNKEEFFIQDHKDISKSFSVVVNVPNNEWQLYVIPVKGYKRYGDIYVLAVLGLLISILGGFFVYNEARRPRQLNELVAERTLQLRQSEEKFSKAFYSNIQGFALYDLEFRIIEMNDAFAGLLEADKADLIGKTGDEVGITSKVPAVKREAFNEQVEYLLQTQGRVYNFETEIETKSGKTGTVLFSIEKLELNNEPCWLISAIDITAMKNAELLLQESESKYRSLIEQASDGIVISDLNGIIREVNNSICKMGGYAHKDLLEKQLSDFIPKDELAINPPRIEELLQGKSILNERRLLKKDGSTIVVEINSKMTNNKMLINFIRDITERKQAEERIRISEEKYRTLVEQASDGIFIAGQDGRFIVVNSSGLNMSQYSEKEMMNMSIYDLVLEEDIRQEPFRFSEMLNGNVARSERRIKRKDGTLLDVEVTAKFISGNRFLAFVSDITERKKIDNTIRYQATLLDAVSDAVASLDINRHIVSWNHACESLFGYTSAEVMNKQISDLVSIEFPNTTIGEVFKQVTETGQWKGEFNFYHPKNRNKYTLLSSLNLLKNKDGKPNGYIITNSDITDRKKAEEEIRKSNERFELIEQATNEVLWDHDFIKNETWGNKKLYELYGLDNDKAKINYEMFISLIHPLEKAAVIERLDKAIRQSATSLSNELLIKTASGQYRNYFDRAYIKYNDEGAPIRILGAMQDITEREIIKKQIIKEKELSDMIINSLPGIFYLFNKDGKYLRWNKNFESVTGYTAEEIRHLHPLDFFDTDEKEEIAKKMANVFTTGEDYAEANFLLKNKQKIRYYFTGQALEYEGESCLMGVGLDFSEKDKAERIIRESEERYRALVENAPEALVVLNVQKQKFVSVSESALKLFKMSREELLNVGPVEMSPEYQPNGLLSSEAAMEKINEAIQGGKPSFEWAHIDKSGNLIPCELRLVRLPSENDILIRGSIIDITERKRAAEELRANADLLRELYSSLQNIREEERTHIAREIHDELGQQLTGLKMDLSWINRHMKTANEAVNEKLVSTLALIDNTINTVRKIASELRPGILDDLGLLAALEWQGEEFEKRSDIKVNFTSRINEMLVLPHIATAFFRIYQELLTNVARHSKASVVNTSIYMEKGNLYLSVEDNGIGFDADKISGKKTLGLRGIKERAGMVGGSYSIQSAPGTGTMVLISVPLHNRTGNNK